MTKHSNGEGGGPFHLIRCAAELTGMYAREVYIRVGEAVLDALDCFEPDSAEDAAIRSTIWGSEDETKAS